MLILLSIFILLATAFNFGYDYISQITPMFISIIIVIHLQYFESLHNPNSINYSARFKLTIVLAHFYYHLSTH